jgi:hypothetical protein
VRPVATGASVVLALSTVLLPWYRLDSYEPNGWDATWWARGALAAALVSIVALQLRRDRLAAAAALVAVVAVAVRVIAVPDFGFGFDGLTVPVERRAGCWVALASSLLALALSVRLAWSRREPASSPTGSSSAAAAP